MEKISIEMRIEYVLSIIHYMASDLLANVGTQSWQAMLNFMPNSHSDEKQVQAMMIKSTVESALKCSTCSDVHRRKAYLGSLAALIREADLYNMVKLTYDDNMANDVIVLQDFIMEYHKQIK